MPACHMLHITMFSVESAKAAQALLNCNPHISRLSTTGLPVKCKPSITMWHNMESQRWGEDILWHIKDPRHPNYRQR